MRESLVTFLNPLRALAARLHPQLPLSRRESERLLKIVTTSFRSRLESKQPHLSDDQHAVAVHLHRVLQNPLFTNFATPGTTSSPNTTTIPEICEATSRPVESFAALVRNGRANLVSAAYCLKCAELNEGVADDSVRALSLVLEWLWASGSESKLAFTGHAGFTAALIDKLVAHRKNEKLMKWLCEANHQMRNQIDDRLASIPLLRLMRLYMRASLRHGGLNLAVQNFNALRRQISNQADKMPLLRLSGYKLIEIILKHDRIPDIDQTIFEEFVSCLKQWSSQNTILYHAERLNMRHPASPSPNPAIQSIMRLADTKRNGFSLNLENEVTNQRDLRLLCREVLEYFRNRCDDAQEDQYRCIRSNIEYLFPDDQALRG